MLKPFLTLAMLAPAIYGLAQEPSVAEIKAKKIKTQTVTSTEKGALTTKVVYFDAEGNDTAVYNNGIRTGYNVIVYGPDGRLEKVSSYDNNGNKKDSTVYTYKPDGSYTGVNTDAQFGLKYYYLYDKKDKLLEYRIPDGSVVKYTYNPKGLLTQVRSYPKDDGVKFTTTYTYNAKNKLVSVKRAGDFGYSSRYEYSPNGLLKKETAVAYGVTTVYTYAYGY